MAKVDPSSHRHSRPREAAEPPESYRAWFDPNNEEDQQQVQALRQAERRRRRLLPVVGTLMTAIGGFLVYALASTGHLPSVDFPRAKHRSVTVEVSALKRPEAQASLSPLARVKPSSIRPVGMAAVSTTTDASFNRDAGAQDSSLNISSSVRVSLAQQRSENANASANRPRATTSRAWPRPRPRRSTFEHRPVQAVNTPETYRVAERSNTDAGTPPSSDVRATEDTTEGTHLIWAETTAEEARRAAGESVERGEDSPPVDEKPYTERREEGSDGGAVDDEPYAGQRAEGSDGGASE